MSFPQGLSNQFRFIQTTLKTIDDCLGQYVALLSRFSYNRILVASPPKSMAHGFQIVWIVIEGIVRQDRRTGIERLGFTHATFGTCLQAAIGEKFYHKPNASRADPG